jgi:hypothetical protein
MTLTVKELIEQLKKYPKNMRVALDTECGNYTLLEVVELNHFSEWGVTSTKKGRERRKEIKADLFPDMDTCLILSPNFDAMTFEADNEV